MGSSALQLAFSAFHTPVPLASTTSLSEFFRTSFPSSSTPPSTQEPVSEVCQAVFASAAIPSSVVLLFDRAAATCMDAWVENDNKATKHLVSNLPSSTHAHDVSSSL